MHRRVALRYYRKHYSPRTKNAAMKRSGQYLPTPDNSVALLAKSSWHETGPITQAAPYEESLTPEVVRRSIEGRGQVVVKLAAQEGDPSEEVKLIFKIVPELFRFAFFEAEARVGREVLAEPSESPKKYASIYDVFDWVRAEPHRSLYVPGSKDAFVSKPTAKHLEMLLPRLAEALTSGSGAFAYVQR